MDARKLFGERLGSSETEGAQRGQRERDPEEEVLGVGRGEDAGVGAVFYGYGRGCGFADG